MAVPNLDPTTTLQQYVNIDISNAQNFWKVTYSKAGGQQNYIGQMEAFYAWFELATQTNLQYWTAAWIEFIGQNTTDPTPAIEQLDVNLQTRIHDENTAMFSFLRDVFEPILIQDLTPLLSGGDASANVLQNFIHPDLAGINDNLTIKLGQIVEEIAFSTATQEARSFDSITLLLQRLDELVAAVQAQGGLDRADWFARFAEGKTIEGRPTVQTIETLTPWVEDQNSLWKKLADWYPKLLLLAGAFSADQLEVPAKLVGPMLKATLDGIEERVRSVGEVPPDQAFDVAAQFLTDAVSAGSRAHMLGLTWELLGPPGKALGVTQLSGLVGELAAFGPIAQGTWGRAITSGVGAPAEQQVNSIMRPTLPSEGQLAEWTVKRKLNRLSQAQALKYHGYSDRWINMIQSTMWTDPSLREIILLAADASVTEFEVEHWLQSAGYEDTDVAMMTPVVMQQSVRGQRQALTSEVLTNLKEGFLSEEDAEAQLDGMRYGEEAKRLILDTGRLGFRREIIQAQISELEQMFQLQQIKEPEFRLALEALGIHKLKIEGILGKAVSKFTGRVSKEEDAQVDKDVREFQAAALATLKAQFAARLIQSETFFANLVAIGFVPAIAREIVALEQLRLFTKLSGEASDEAERLRNDIVRARMAAFIDFFQDDFINEDQLRGNLLALGLAAALVEAIVFREVAKKLEQPKPPKPAPTR